MYFPCPHCNASVSPCQPQSSQAYPITSTYLDILRPNPHAAPKPSLLIYTRSAHEIPWPSRRSRTGPARSSRTRLVRGVRSSSLPIGQVEGGGMTQGRGGGTADPSAIRPAFSPPLGRVAAVDAWRPSFRYPPCASPTAGRVALRTPSRSVLVCSGDAEWLVCCSVTVQATRA